MKIVVMSDTHGDLSRIKVPPGDLLLHCGDLTVGGTYEELEQAAYDLTCLPHRHKVVIAGNHDYLFQSKPQDARWLFRNLCYLQDEACVVEGIKIYGTPWQPDFKGMAFNMVRNSDGLGAKWWAIPEDTDILMTHGPPGRILDRADGRHLGCDLLDYRLYTMAKPPRLHCFGHIHEARGMVVQGGTHFVNAACAGRRNPPFVLDWEQLACA